MKMLGSIVLGLFLILQTQIGFANHPAKCQQTDDNNQTNSAYLLVDFHWNNSIP